MHITKSIEMVVIGVILTMLSMTGASQVKAQNLDDLIADSTMKLKNEADALKTEIANTDLKGTGKVEDLINKVYYYEGAVSVYGGGTWAYLYDVQDALIAKIKETGESGFTVPEQAAIVTFATNAEQVKLENPVVDVFG